MLNQKKILYIDDEEINLILFDEIFQRSFKVITADSGAEGLRLLRSDPGIACVVSDMKMPEMNGIQFIEEARKEFPDITYYILSGYDISTEINSALENNLIVKFFHKPFNQEEIIESLSWVND